MIGCWGSRCCATRIVGSRRSTFCDGQEALWQARGDYLPDKNAVEILDLLHVTPRLWQAAKLFYGERSPQVVPFVRHRVTQVLQGKVEGVVRGLRRLAKERKLSAAKKKARWHAFAATLARIVSVCVMTSTWPRATR